MRFSWKAFLGKSVREGPLLLTIFHCVVENVPFVLARTGECMLPRSSAWVGGGGLE